MFQVISEINLVAVAVAAIASFVLGGLWFAVLFATPYSLALGRQNVPKQTPSPLFLVGPFACGLVTALTSAILMAALKIESIGDAIAFGSIVGLGYLASTTVNTAINPNIPRPLFYGLISGSYFFVSSVMVCSILVAMA
jgi:Protein of unknown function (DUF1761)